MATIVKQYKYHCDNDCCYGGCDGHIAEMTFQTTSTVFSFDDGNGQTIHFDKSSMLAFLKMMKSLEYRADSIQFKSL